MRPKRSKRVAWVCGGGGSKAHRASQQLARGGGVVGGVDPTIVAAAALDPALARAGAFVVSTGSAGGGMSQVRQLDATGHTFNHLLSRPKAPPPVGAPGLSPH